MNRLLFWMTIYRGAVAILLGLVLLIGHGREFQLLVSYMGFFWLASGFASVRWGMAAIRARWPSLMAGVVGVLAGMSVLGRRFFGPRLPDSLGLTLLGIIIIMTGLLHFFVGIRHGKGEDERTQSVASQSLGVLEVALGILLVVIPPEEQGPLLFLAATIWAFFGGLVLLSQALWIRRQFGQAT